MQNISNIRSWSQKSTAIAVVSIIALAGLLFFVQQSEAHQDPVACFSTGVGLSLSVYRADGTTPVGAGSVAVGETLKYQATLSHLGGTNCNYEGGTLTLTTPNGTVNNVTPGGGIPLVTTGSPFVSALVTYVVASPDIGGDNDIDASSLYSGGTSHTGTTHSVVGSNTTTQNNLKGKIIVEKQTLPNGSAQSFAFTGSLSGSITDGLTLELVVDPGQYTSTETPIPAGWSLTSIVCSD
ncbi:MAG: hypothetical protein Q8R08_01905, partial [bacterium]|nr:hypothetical protein [bacterium]